MNKILFMIVSAVTMFGLISCTMEMNQPSSATPLAADVSPSPTPLASNMTNIPLPTTESVPITWSDLDLSGRLVYSTVSTNGEIGSPKIKILNLVTGENQTAFAATGNAWIYYLAISPDQSQLIMSYVPPSPPGSEAGTSLYSLSLVDGASPQILFTPPTSSERYVQVEWAPDGKYLYFVHYNHDEQPAGQPFPDYQISRMAYPGGQPEKIIDHAFWPRVSPDSSMLVYVTLDPVSGDNKLFLSNADGSDPQEIIFSGAPQIIDAPIFLPDGSTVLFSAPSPIQAYQPNWLDRLMGIQIAKAHNVPSDWWSIPASGGTVTRLTQIQTIRLFASISPDQRYIASMSGEGLLVMGMDGSNLRQLLFDPGVSSVVNWMP